MASRACTTCKKGGSERTFSIKKGGKTYLTCDQVGCPNQNHSTFTDPSLPGTLTSIHHPNQSIVSCFEG